VITDVRGVRVGHWTDAEAQTGCTVVLLPSGTVASGEVRGGAPGTREWELLAPERLVAQVDAVVLSGGSAFGLAACDGVVHWCEERGLGYPTRAGVVPIVVGAVLYDLAVGDPAVRPDAAAGYAACEAAATGAFGTGSVGAGCGARTGLGTATERHGDVVVSAVVAVNAFGTVRGPEPVAVPDAWSVPFGNTTIGVIATNARLDKTACLLTAQSGHDGLARALEPAHTTVDGDALVAAATGEVDAAALDLVRMLAARAVESAVRSAAK
jgi:L-aminopeptidase/D-esterase-like protein